MKHQIVILVFSFFALITVGAELSYDGKTISLRNIECREERNAKSQVAQLRIFAGQFQRDIDERFELLLLSPEKYEDEGKYEIVMSPKGNLGDVCLATLKERRKPAYQTFCLAGSGKGNCRVQLQKENDSWKVSLECKKLAPSALPSSEQISLNISNEAAIECSSSVFDPYQSN